MPADALFLVDRKRRCCRQRRFHRGRAALECRV